MRQPRFAPRALAAALAVAATGGALACYPNTVETVEETQFVATAYDSTFDFGAVQRYAIDDSVFRLSISGGNWSRQVDDAIIAEFRTQLNALGWTEVAYNGPGTGSTAQVVAIAAGSTGSWEVWGTGCWYYWCYWYPWYPPTYYYEFETGGVFLTLVDPNRPEDPVEDAIASTWGAAMGGLLSGTISTAKIQAGIRQAFAQSPYLNP